jgi:GNAT superfamily N-acetyltransferase
MAAIQAPYVPTLGVVAPDVLSAELFDAVTDVAHSCRFLPYDKDQRWFATKDERVLTGDIIHRPDRTVIPTLTVRGGRLVKIHHYSADGSGLDEVKQYAARLATQHAVAEHRVLWFTAEESGRAHTRLMLETFDHADQRGLKPVVELAGNCFAGTFSAFAHEIEPDGLAFLHERILRGYDDGPILISINNRRIVGAIGPLSTLTDAVGVRYMPPPYFAVHPEHRGQGRGRALRRAAAEWGQRHGAAYQVLQAASGSAAEHLYLSEGLRTLGFLHTTS